MGGKGYDVTIHGLHKWFRAEFEKFGWMLLAKKYGNTEKIAQYKRDVHDLRDSIVQRWTLLGDNDAYKHDLKIILEHTDILVESLKMLK